jgi:hypothetical protein
VKEIRKASPFTIASKKIKYLGTNITKEVKDSTMKTIKTIRKEIEDTRRWKELPCSWIRGIL